MNLIDPKKEIDGFIRYFNNNNESIMSIEINEYTLNYLKSKGIYAFSDAYNKEIPIIINSFILDNEIKFNRVKNIKATEYEPYEIRGDDK